MNSVKDKEIKKRAEVNSWLSKYSFGKEVVIENASLRTAFFLFSVSQSKFSGSHEKVEGNKFLSCILKELFY